MTFRKTIYSLVMLLFLTVPASAGPVRDMTATYTQPDGSTFPVLVKGDEWSCIRTTTEGCAIIRDEDGWWCYGIYDSEGRLSSTGHRVGQAPASVISASGNIPYEVLARRAGERRNVGRESVLNMLEGIRKSAVRTKAGGSKIQKRGLALLVEFSDVKFKYTKEDFIRLLNEKGYNGTGSAKDYYEFQFGADWEFTFDVSNIITLNHTAKHYGENKNGEQAADVRPWDMIKEACEAADPDIDFSLYNQDGDDYVDNVYVFYAGQSEAENTENPDLIWPHQYYILQGKGINLSCDGVKIDRYACSAEISGKTSLTGIGSFCHEYGHTFGLVDLYDTDYDDAEGWAPGTWRRTSLMDGGNYNNDSATPPNFNCIEREILGLSEARPLEVGNSYTLDPIHKNGLYYRLDTDKADEYYLFECRSNEGWDSHIGGKGMLVYHIDKARKYRWTQNTVNADLSHQCADLIEADGRDEAITEQKDLKQDISGIFFPQDDVTAMTPETVPTYRFWSGETPEISVTGISAQGEDISFSVVYTSQISAVPSPVSVKYTTYPDAVLIHFASSDPNIESSVSLKWKKVDSENDYKSVVPTEYEKGKYVCKITGLESGSITYETKISFSAGTDIGTTYTRSFMTKRAPAVSWPYIYMESDGKISRSSGIDLHVVNSKDAPETHWYFNGESIKTAPDGRFYPDGNGLLSAKVLWKNGSTDTLAKEIELIGE